MLFRRRLNQRRRRSGRDRRRARRRRRRTRPPARRRERQAQKIRVTTDVLVLDISLTGGTLVRAELPGYPRRQGRGRAAWCCSTRDSPTTNYVLRPASRVRTIRTAPTHLATFTAPPQSFTLAPGQDELRVPLTWTDGNGVTVTKTFVFHRSMFAIGLEYQIANETQAPWACASVCADRAHRSARRALDVQGGELRDARPGDLRRMADKYRKLKIDKDDDATLSIDGARTAGSPACSITS